MPLDKACDYAAEDADICLRLHRLFKPRLAAKRMTVVYETIERPLIEVLVAMEGAGIKADRDELVRLSGDFAQRIAKLEKEIHALGGVLKDRERGLIYFHSRRDGRKIYLIWDMNHTDVVSWHELGETYSDRILVDLDEDTAPAALDSPELE